LGHHIRTDIPRAYDSSCSSISAIWKLSLARKTSLIFMQDNVLGHAAKETVELIASLAIQSFKLPSYSPDLNPIKTVWKYIKEYLQKKYRDLQFRNYDELKRKVSEAWDIVVTPGLLRELIEGIPDRIKAVITTNRI
jgi:transposase